MTRRTSTVILTLALGTAASADVSILTFNDGDWDNGVTGLTGTYVDWDFGTFTQNADSFEVQSTAAGGGWATLPNPFLNGVANGEDTLSLTIDIAQDNEATGVNVVLFDANATQAGFAFDITGLSGLVKMDADLLNPTFFNAGDQNSWDPSQIGDQIHIQGNFANGNPLHISFENLSTTPAPSAIALLGLGGLVTSRRRR